MAIFRRHFESRFEPIDIGLAVPSPTSPKASKSPIDEGSDADSFSSGADSSDPGSESEEVEVVEVSHSHTSSNDVAVVSKREKKIFMVDFLPVETPQ